MDKFCIKECTLESILSGLSNMQDFIYHKQHLNKASRLHVIVSLVVFPFVFCTIFSVEFLG